MNMPSAALFSLLIVALSSLCAGPPAVARESGRFELVEKYAQDYTTLEHAGGRSPQGPLEGTATVVKSSGGPFAEGGNWRIACVVYARSLDAGLDLETPCTLTDGSGDRVYLLAERWAGDVSVGGGDRGPINRGPWGSPLTRRLVLITYPLRW